TDALAKANASVARALAEAAHHDFVPILQKGTRLAARQRDRLRPAPRALEETTTRLVPRPGNRAARPQISRTHVASVRRVMRDELRDGPVHLGKSSRVDEECSRPGVAHLRRAEIHLERYVDSAGIAHARR